MSKCGALCVLFVWLIVPALGIGCSLRGAIVKGGTEAPPDQKALGADLLNKAGGGTKGAPAPKAGGEKTGGAEKASEDEKAAEPTEKAE